MINWLFSFCIGQSYFDRQCMYVRCYILKDRYFLSFSIILLSIMWEEHRHRNAPNGAIIAKRTLKIFWLLVSISTTIYNHYQPQQYTNQKFHCSIWQTGGWVRLNGCYSMRISICIKQAHSYTHAPTSHYFIEI